MKTKRIFRRLALLVSAMAFCMGNAYGQWNSSKAHLIVDWQMNAPLSPGFADKISGWGMNIEGLYDITSRWSAGAFINFHTNHKYIDRQVLSLSPTESLTTDQQRSAYQLPFGAATAYNLYNSDSFKFYAGAKLGAVYARNTTYYGTGGVYDSAWGFYASPELGIKVFPFREKKIGLHLAGYYSFMTNQTVTLTTDIDGQSNAGFRLGIIF